MQRVPSKSIPIDRPNANGRAEIRYTEPEERITPLAAMSRRIREEQGADRLKEFLLAMRPYFAPNELIKVGRSFGIELERDIVSNAIRQTEDASQTTKQEIGVSVNASQQNQFAQLMQRLIMLQNLMGPNGKSDPSALIKLLGGM